MENLPPEIIELDNSRALAFKRVFGLTLERRVCGACDCGESAICLSVDQPFTEAHRLFMLAFDMGWDAGWHCDVTPDEPV